jgi:Tol biopolymer transport system component
MPLAGPLADTDHVLGHELVHAFQYDIASRRAGPEGQVQNGLHQLPLWFVEGMAEYLSLGPVDVHTAMWIKDAIKTDKLPSIDDLDKPEYFPYRWGHAFWAYVAGRRGDQVVPRMLGIAADTGDANTAIQRVLGVSADEFSREWQAANRAAYASAITAIPQENAWRPVIKAADFGSVNVGPAISPDGRWIAFLSERSLFAIDLFVADATSGKIVRRLTRNASSPHYSSLQFIYSAGAWDKESRRIAIATVTGGRPALAVFDALNGSREREIEIEGVDEVFNPTWSPDGTAIAFTGMTGGLTDLFVYDLQNSRLRRLTNDTFADLQPAWSPDGRRIAFTTDRYATELDTLDVGEYRLALLDPASGRVEPLRVLDSGNDINPQWSSDSRAVYFLSDRNGVQNLYRVMLAGGDPVQLTGATTGLSGITASSPALSVASQTDIAAFSVFEDGNYSIYAIDLARGVSPAPGESTSSKTLPPLQRETSEVADLLADPSGAPPESARYPIEDYSPGLSLENIGQTVVAVGADRFGATIGSGLAMSFADVLNTHSLTTVVQFNTGFSGGLSAKDIGAQAAYVNQARRWNWGFIGGQVPYLTGSLQSGLATFQGTPVQVDRTVLFRQTERAVSGLVSYPFDRARRIEFQAGVTRISFDQITRTDAYSLFSGARVFSESEETSLASPLGLATSSAAFVSDTSNFGATSPVQGERYRLEIAPNMGSITFTGLLADYRRYLMPARFYTIAGRVLHYGRYGAEGEDTRLAPLYLGYPSLVRGYDVNTFDPRECVATAVSACQAFDRLIGSRMLVANLEFRFPLLRPFGVSQRMYGPLPMEVAFFADGGVAWLRGQKPELFGGSRSGVSSVGVTLRANLLGFAIGQFDIARPLQRPAAGWVFQFNLTPGF